MRVTAAAQLRLCVKYYFDHVMDDQGGDDDKDEDAEDEDEYKILMHTL